jgi:plasmid maintenance system antidote protein VapI
MSESKKPAPISDLLRQTIAEAVNRGQTNFKALERETGVTRASIMRFVRGNQFLRLDMADRLAARFGLHLADRSRRAARQSRPGRTT